jgi:hypothetical protein
VLVDQNGSRINAGEPAAKPVVILVLNDVEKWRGRNNEVD